ncbi:MAG TPA: hypothetical protein DEG17_22085 [Cyanobacteria bacterium UBA11149]|nr:hypothetical protein [Cyanobacteria bacterium UBA11367]HBE56907.1 hypothetical protein [Cyanobacteria bacterium UBA11366]HBK64102.1 hypothetical protein [Cyanobacteria bacterium UBA11166]HBR75296.1 hypothetical protein [Cyanobacteria bacterium UBA11159]HBS72386.1 hypothetical protein [Cyanobacteria bacterium UBA11153]HBW91472.1 hypothetical protein [Cyanobacteria bacterium UBA11149]HCA98204.1 hypothetical protein [Cyanobacteria bacterium UBA9226]
MVQRLKRWESPRRQGRNDKGKGGAARSRQLKKQTQMLRKKLKEEGKKDDRKGDNQNPKNPRKQNRKKREETLVCFSLFFGSNFRNYTSSQLSLVS